MPSKKLKLALVREPQATGRVKEIFEDLKRTLGVPLVPLLYKAYAAYPKFLNLHWSAFKPLLQTEEFFELCDRLRADAYTRVQSYFKVPDLRRQMDSEELSLGARYELNQDIDLLYFLDAPVLLIAVIQMQAFDGPVGQTRPIHSAGRILMRPRPVVVEETAAPPATCKIYQELKQSFGLPALNLDYRVLARWPDFLRDYWNLLKPMVSSPIYQESTQRVRETALGMAGQIPLPIELTLAQLDDAGVGHSDLRSIVQITESLINIFSALMLNITIAKIGLEGGNASATIATATSGDRGEVQTKGDSRTDRAA